MYKAQARKNGKGEQETMKEVKPNCENGKIKLNNIYKPQDELSAQDIIDDVVWDKSKPISLPNASGDVLQHFRSISIAPMSPKELTAIFDSYIQRYGNITISELLDKMEVEHLRLS